MAYLKDVAAASGLSIRTVARALTKTGSINPLTRDRVLAHAARLGYRPNLAARSLKTAKSFDVVAVVGKMTELHASKLTGLERALHQANYSLHIVFEHDPSKSEAFLESVRDRQPAGVAIFPKIRVDVVEAVGRFCVAQIPYIVFDARVEGVDGVRIDRQQGVYESVLYLAAKGRQRIAFLGPRNDQSRVGGYLRALRQLGREPLFLDLPQAGDAFESGRAAGVALADVPNRPDAVQSHTDIIALGLLAGLHQQGLQIPKDIAVVGFDNRLAASLSWPPLTTVAQPSEEMGEIGAELLLRKIRNEPPPAGGWSRCLPTRLVIRESA